MPKISTGSAGTLQFEQGKQASARFKAQVEKRLKKPNSNRRRNLFVSTSEAPFDNYHRLLAYISPSYSSNELSNMSRKERATFNLDLIESGWAAPFIVFPNIPGELDLPLFLEVAESAQDARLGQYGDSLSLPAFEYRMCEKLHGIARKIAEGTNLSAQKRLAWRSRYSADMRKRILYGPEGYMSVPLCYRIWIWPEDVQKAIGALNLTPSDDLVS